MSEVPPLYSVSARACLTAVAALAAVLVAAGCSSSSSSSSSSVPAGASSSPSASTSASAGGGSADISISVSDLDNSFSVMSQLKPVAAAGKGTITVILPGAATSARYVELDAPYLKQAFADAGLPSSDYSVENAGSDATQFSMAQSAITKGARVLVVDPLDSGVGAHIESYARQHGVAVIDYDRLALGGTRSYYVSFNDVKAGKVMGQGLASCITAWGVKNPNVIVMKAAPDGNNATLFAQGYDAVTAPYFSSGKWKDVSNLAWARDPATALSEFRQQFAAHKNIDAALIPDDENAAAIIGYLKGQGVKPRTFPITGQNATLTGLRNILAGYQCGTVYKPVYLEAQAAAALALYLRAGKTPPSSLVNGATEDTTTRVSVPSVLLSPTWVTTSNMNSTVIADKLVPASRLCAGSYASACKAAGIPS